MKQFLQDTFNTVRTVHAQNVHKHATTKNVAERITQRIQQVPQMDKLQAFEILNLNPETQKINKQILEEKYFDLYQRNSETQGGSLYIRSKINNAYEILKKDYNQKNNQHNVFS